MADLDAEAPEAVAEEPPSAAGGDTVDTAPRGTPADDRRLRALHQPQDLAAEGALDAELLLGKRAYRGSGPLR
ncbi:type II toxin-antitoxin system VapB family antitoxin [Streptomyces sp. NPDC017936]|uniref:type II toxin-antitoxin system VapB family antitoxin n=1 Tax=Streptomyces sp. NPDC017936 TaxID=3365016 RepID=UPI0037AF023A